MSSYHYSPKQKLVLVLLRLLIGWHFLYEACVKLQNSSWSSRTYLLDYKGTTKELFFDIAQSETLLHLADQITIWGLLIVGSLLILGLFAKYAKYLGILFLGLYYLSHPPLIGLDYALPSEGSYLWIDKNLIEMAAMVVLLYFPTSQYIGLDRLRLQLK